MNWLSEQIKIVSVKVQQVFGKQIDLGEEIIEVMGTSVFVNDDAVRLRGIPAYVPGAVLGTNVEGEFVICINRKMMEMDEWFIDACLIHEVGHKEYRISGKIGTADDEEYFADAFVHDNGYLMYVTLLKMQGFGYSVSTRLRRLSAHIEKTKMCCELR